MGPIGKQNGFALDFILLLFLWTVGDLVFHIPATISAFIGLVILLLTNIMSWKNIVAETTAWDTMFWFAVLVMMANALINAGCNRLDFHPHFLICGRFQLASCLYYFGVGVFLYPLFLSLQPWRIFRNVSRFRGSGYCCGYTTNHCCNWFELHSTLSMSLTQYAGGPGQHYTVQVITQPVNGGDELYCFHPFISDLVWCGWIMDETTRLVVIPY